MDNEEMNLAELLKQTAEENQTRKILAILEESESLEDAKEKALKYGCDGIMIGRGVFGNPFFFSTSQREVSVSLRLATLVEHTKLFEEILGKYKNFAIMKKHFKAYVNGWDGAKELRVKLMETENATQVEAIIKKFIQTF